MLYFDSLFFPSGQLKLPRISYKWFIDGFESVDKLIRSDEPFSESSMIIPFNRLTTVGSYVEVLSNSYDGLGGYEDIGVYRDSEDTFGIYRTPHGVPPTGISSIQYPMTRQIGDGVRLKNAIFFAYACYNDNTNNPAQFVYFVDDGTGTYYQVSHPYYNDWDIDYMGYAQFFDCTVTDAQLYEDLLHQPTVTDFQVYRTTGGLSNLLLNTDVTGGNGGATQGFPVNYEGGFSTGDNFGNGQFNWYGDSVSDSAPYGSGVLDCGLVTMWNPTKQQLQQLGNYLNTDSFFESLKKTWSDPMESIISLSLFPCKPPASSTTSGNIMLGGIDTHVNSTRVTGDYTSFKYSFGTINFPEYYGTFQDYTPITEVTIFLPFIGFKQLNVKDITSTKIKLDYNVDFLNGDVLAEITTIDGLNRNIDCVKGNCSINVPLTSTNYTGMYQGVLSTLANAGSANVIGLANSVASPKVHTERSGGISGSAGLNGSFIAYILINRQGQVLPEYYGKTDGYPLSVSGKVKDFSGFTMGSIITDEIDIASEEEKNMIISLFESGVYL